jgi:hypothetical protein
MTKSSALFAVGGALGLVLLLWALTPLGKLIPSTAGMLQTTRAIRQETLSLETSVAQVDGQLAGLAEQEMLLQKQGELMDQALSQLKGQEAGAREATTRLRQLAALEQQTVQLTADADVASTKTAEVLKANGAALGRLSQQMGRIEDGSAQMSGQVDLLLGEMARAEANFEPIKRWKDGWQHFQDGVSDWWQGVGKWIDSWFH